MPMWLPPFCRYLPALYRISPNSSPALPLYIFQVPLPELGTCPVPPLTNVTWQARVEAQMADMRSQVNRFSVDANKRAQADALRQSLLARLNQPGYNVAHLPADLNTVAQGYNNNPTDVEANRISAELFEYARTVARVSDPHTPGSTFIPPHLLIPSASQYLRDLDSSPTSKTEADLVDRARGIAKLQKDLSKIASPGQPQFPFPGCAPFPSPPTFFAAPPTSSLSPPPFSYPPVMAQGGRGRGFVPLESRDCYNCGGRGHLAKDCPHPPNPSSRGGRGGRGGRGPPPPPSGPRPAY
jgi:hypothetical protein